MMPKIISATEASNNFGSVIDEAAQGKSYFVITWMGKAKAVVLGVEQYRDLMEELVIVQEQDDEAFQGALLDARRDIELGRTVTLDELDEELGITDKDSGS